MIRTVQREVEQPVVILARDASSSLTAVHDTAFIQQEFPAQWQQLEQELGQDLEVRSYTFGEQVRVDEKKEGFPDKETDISALLEEVRTRYEGRNLGAVVLATDGLYNKGSNPLYSLQRFQVPVYPVALGDTVVRKDLLINDVAHNRLAYLGNHFPLEILVEARRCQGEETILTVSREGEVLLEKELAIGETSFSRIVPVQLEAKETGLQRYTVALSPLEGEVSTVNNTKEVFIDVLDSRREVLLLAHAPHPDLRALRFGIESKAHYEVRTETADDFSGSVEPYDLVILHQLPSGRHRVRSLLEELREEKVPTLFVVGGQSDLNRMNELGTGVTFRPARGRMNEASPVREKGFTLFQLSEAAWKSLEEMPPLHVPFAKTTTGNSVSTLFRQKIGQVKTGDPLVAFNDRDGRKTGIIMGEGNWRWRLFDRSDNDDFPFYNEWVTKMVQYLSVKEDKSYFRVSSQNDIRENERILFKAELYNKSYELVNEPEATMTITDAEGREYPFSFTRTSDAYRLDAGRLPVGEYSYRATTSYNGKEYVEEGVFSVSPVRVELANTVADHQLLYKMARQSNGELFYPGQLDQLSGLLQDPGNLKPVSYAQEELTDLINLRWLFFLLLGVLSLEWGTRKWNGAY